MKLPKMDIPVPEQSKITLNLCFHVSPEVLLMAEEATRPVLPVFEIWEEGMDVVFEIIYPFYELLVRNGHLLSTQAQSWDGSQYPFVLDITTYYVYSA